MKISGFPCPFRTKLPAIPAGHTLFQLRVTRVILNSDGTEFKRVERKKNLVLDQGLDNVAAYSYATLTRYCHRGTGTNPFIRDSGSVTFTVASGTVTASSNFFEAGDTGRLLKLDSGEEYYLTYVSATQCTVTGADAAASEGTIYYVNRTTLQTETDRTLTCRTSAGDNERSYNGTFRQFTYRRSHLFPAESGSITYQEIGWGPVNTTALFSGLVLSGGGDSLVAGQQYLVISELIITPTPTESTPAPDVGSGGWNTEGDINIESQTSIPSRAFSTIDSSGAPTGTGVVEPYVPSEIAALGATFTLVTPMGTADIGAPAGTVWKAASLGSYAPSQFYIDKVATFGVSEANMTWHGVGHFAPSTNRILSLKFDTPQVKDDEHTVIVVFRFSWQRVLVN